MNQLNLPFDWQEGRRERRVRPQGLNGIADVVNSTRKRIHRLRPPVKAHGGKYYLAKEIAPILLSAPGNPTEYLEPCAFGASVFLSLPRFEHEILGDMNPDVVALWRTLSTKSSAQKLAGLLADIGYTRENFEAAQARTAVDEIQQAVRFVVSSRFSRGGLRKSFAWSDRKRGGKPGDVNSWDTYRETVLPKIIDRAKGVNVVRDSCWWTVWESRHRTQRLIYADPPYMPQTRTARKAYGEFEMSALEHFWLVSALRAHSGPAAISGYRCDEYDDWLRDWRRIEFDVANNAGQNKKKQRRREVLWCNW